MHFSNGISTYCDLTFYLFFFANNRRWFFHGNNLKSAFSLAFFKNESAIALFLILEAWARRRTEGVQIVDTADDTSTLSSPSNSSSLQKEQAEIGAGLHII